MKIEDLIFLSGVCKYGSLSQAAEGMFISRQTLSKRMQSLEAELGMAIFNRDYSGIRLTQFGKLFVEKSNLLLNQYYELENFVKQYEADFDRKISVGIRGSFTVAYTLQRLINEFECLHKDISFSIRTCGTDEALRMVSEGELDFAYIIMECELPDSLTYIKLAETEQLFLMNKKHPLACKKCIRPEMLNNERIMITNFSNTPMNALIQFASIGNANPDIFFYTSDLQLIYQSVASDKILSMLKKNDVEMAERYDNNLISKSGDPKIITKFALIFRKDMPMTPSRKAFLNYIQQEMNLQ